MVFPGREFLRTSIINKDKEMGCASCSVSQNGVPQGCGNKGHCTSGSCNKKNTFDWLATLDIHDPLEYRIVEVSFKKGNHKKFFINPESTGAETGDMVVVESSNGYDIGRISLSGDLVRIQMKKKNKEEESIIYKIIRRANERDLEKLAEARKLEQKALVRSRAIARTLDLEMKIGDVEYQGDKRKATFYYTADGRVDFRELVRLFAKEFRVKIEMKQIGSRQESSLIGGVGTCGRELCCSTWKSSFETVTTTAARYQNLAINQTKLTGQCGRLKCCLNYELDTYVDALGDFPEKADSLKLEGGVAQLIKTDIFKGLMYYSVQKENFKGPLIAISKEKVKQLLELNKRGKAIEDISNLEETAAPVNEEDMDNIELDFADVTGEIELPDIKRRRKKNRKSKRRNPNKSNKPRGNNNSSGDSQTRSEDKKQTDSGQPKNKAGGEDSNRKNKSRNWRRKKRNNKNTNNKDNKDS